MKPIKIKDNLFLVQTGPIGTNTYFFNTNPVVVIDPGYGISNFVEEECVVLLTHTHFDHIYGLKELKVQKVFVSKEDSQALKDPEKNLSVLFSTRFTYNGAFEILQEKLEIAEISFQVIKTPGHTPGSVVYKVNDLWFTGDTIFFDSIGRTDLPGSDGKTMLETLKRLVKIFRSAREEELILPGHMEWGTIKEVLSNNPFLKEVL
ncbi:MBL fold metallo-hydrolase [Pseudothermotoga thermarum]|uniref:Beta-lactamase domain-containing protein n=1 Tax=Pseudothermotoga thermarum DSM 5069 TaxID=688269 RepID=F7YWU9_9THEM|nr:MBL fold metallo-hydrolase [Pseudothermotoga thermarum]AEH50466.1 beta-lactamase domain-containing protein [Pseudothermotoga thermarum DSM 5069]